MSIRYIAFGLVFVAGCLPDGQTPQHTRYHPAPGALGELGDERLIEVSGIVASRRHPGLYYVHNDSGGKPQVYLIDRSGRTRLVIHLKGAFAMDYEDIAIAPAAKAGEFDVCVADIGDNNAKRRFVTIYRFAEPALEEDDGGTLTVTPAVYTIRYAGGPADAEAFCVHPRTGDGYVLTKHMGGEPELYRLAAPWSLSGVTELPRIHTIEMPRVPPPQRVVTAADISSDGRRFAVRCYTDGWEWVLPADDEPFKKAFESKPQRLPLAPESQGEALCYSADGQAILTVSEGLHPTLFELRVKDAESEAAP